MNLQAGTARGLCAALLFGFTGCSSVPVSWGNSQLTPTKAEDLTGSMQKALDASGADDVRTIYSSTGIRPLWSEQREQVLAVLRAAALEDGLDNTDAAAWDVAASKNLMRLALETRYGRANPAIYEKPDLDAGPSLVRQIAEDPEGVAAGLHKLDPPFEEYRRLAAALPAASPEQRALVEESLERWRWLPHSFERGAILVNIPEAMVRVIDSNNQVVLEMRAVVGLPTHQTPVFAATLKHVVFAPYWNVPESILRSELLPDLRKDRTYFQRNEYEVLEGKTVISTGEVSDELLERLEKGGLNVRQVPGKKNALGRVKFLFPNDNNVYLHDTNAPALFARERRALSHGCVRVQNPRALAEWVLRDEAGWTSAKVAEALRRTTQFQVDLKEPIPVLMLYHRATADADGTIHIWPDVYRKVPD